MMNTDPRLEQLRQWLSEQLGSTELSIAPASADASFRRYFRVTLTGRTYIAMDAPPAQEDIAPFIDVTQRLLRVGATVPRIHATDLANGFLLLDDLGQTHYLAVLSAQSVESLYADATHALAQLHTADTQNLPRYDQALLEREMSLFPDWLLVRHLGLALTEKQSAKLNDAFQTLQAVALEQPRCFVHRDYHSRNLMYLEQNNPGIIDYQDAVYGPLTYDLVSLLRDCYIAWPQTNVQSWALAFRDRLLALGVIDPIGDTDFLRWFDLMGVQRHLKASGIFARLFHRDGKPGYLREIPRTINYIFQVGPNYTETQSLIALLDDIDLSGHLHRVSGTPMP